MYVYIPDLHVKIILKDRSTVELLKEFFQFWPVLAAQHKKAGILCLVSVFLFTFDKNWLVSSC